MTIRLKRNVFFVLTILFVLTSLLTVLSPTGAKAANEGAGFTDTEAPGETEEPSESDIDNRDTNSFTLSDSIIIYIPFRAFIEQIGGIIEYDANTGRILAITPDNKAISHVPGTKSIVINGKHIMLDLPSLLKDGVMYFPLSTLNLILENKISFDYAANTVSLDLSNESASSLVDVLKACREYKYYLPQNLFRYMAYIKANPDIKQDVAVAYVNANVDREFYTDISMIENPDSILVLCTKSRTLPEDYAPSDLVYIPGTYYMLRNEAAKNYNQMKKAAAADGVYFTVYSAYRSYATQKGLYNRYVERDGVSAADGYSARPGHSEHQAGLAVDLTTYGDDSGFQYTSAYNWLSSNAYKYGFILRYPKGYDNITGYIFESWHWRYIGIEAATRMHNEKIATYEEYCGKYLVN